MKMVVFELGLIEEFNNGQLFLPISVDANTILTHLRPHIYLHNLPAGGLFMEVQDANGRRIKQSDTRAIASLTTATYFHGYVKFTFEEVGLRKGTEYRLALKSTGYTYSASSFVGWVNGHDLGKQTESYPNKFGVNAALDTELWSRQPAIKTVNA